MQDYDDTVAFLGQWGRFQQVVFFLLCVCMVPNGIVSFCSVFLADTPSHHCLIPEVNLTRDWQNATIPTEVQNGKEVLSSCSRYRLDVVRNLSARGLVPGRDVNLTDLEQESCVDGWSYSKDIYQSTLVTEYDLVCSEQWKQPFTSTAFLLGVLFGSFFSGQVSDRIGRKPVLFGAMAFQAFSGVLQLFIPSWTTFSILFFITGVGRVSSYVSGFILGAEILTHKVRVLFSSLGVCLSFSAGYMLLPLLAYFLRDWKSLLITISLLSVLYLPLWWVIPESPRWLLSQGRIAEAEAILRKAARMNKVEVPEMIFEGFSFVKEEKEEKGEKGEPQNEHHNILHLLKTSNIRNITLIVCLVWFTLRTGYYGLSFNTSQLHADPYVSCFMSAAVEIPANILMWLTLRYLPRRLSVICILVLAAASLFFIQLVPQGLPSVAVSLEMLGKFAVTAGSSLMYVYTAELYPTVLRNTGTGACSVLSRVGSSVAPFLFKLKIYFYYLPYITLGALAVGSALSALFLPETFRKPLPQTIEQMPKRKGIKCPFKSSRKERSTAEVLSESTLTPSDCT